MNEGELVRFTPLICQYAIFVCRTISQIHNMPVEITKDHIHLWGSEVVSEAESLIRCFVDTSTLFVVAVEDESQI